MALWKQGEERAFDTLYERHFIRLVNIAYKKTGNLEASQDLVQDVFVAFHKQRPFLQPDTIPEHYLLVAVKNRVLNYHRQLLSELKKEQALRNEPLPAARLPHNELELKELKALLAARIQALPPQCRTVFLLSREEQLSNKEVAARLNISVNTVEQHMRKALRLLRSSMNGELMLILLWVMSSEH